MDYDAKQIGDLLNGAEAFFSDTPPPGALTMTLQGNQPVHQAASTFDMNPFSKGPGGVG